MTGYYLMVSPTDLVWWAAYPGALGYLPEFLSEADPRTAAEQFHANYQFGGWQPGGAGLRFKYTPGPDGGAPGSTLLYPGDPPLRAIGGTTLRAEQVTVYQTSFVMVRQPDGSHEVARLD